KVLAEIAPRVERGLAARRARFEKNLTPYDGAISPELVEKLAEIRGDGVVFSPSGLEGYAACPQKYFLSSVLRLRDEEEPEELVQISPLDRGSLIHRILQRFLSERPKREPLLTGPGEEARLLAITDEECDRVEEKGRTGFTLIWAYDRSQIREDMRRWLAREIEDDWVKSYPDGDYEVRFGPWRGEDDEGPHSPDEARRIGVDGV